ncbi:MAG: acyl carrier protein [Nitrospirota bacterium]|nr:acyl carrier protein [Nitrospirota bacterium]
MPPDVTVAERICNALAHHLKRDAAAILPQQSLRNDLGLNSVDTFELFFDLEDAFDIEIHDQDIQRLVTVSDLVGYVEGRLTKTPSDSNR